MTDSVNIALFALAGLVLVPLAVLTAEVVLSLFARPPETGAARPGNAGGPRTVVLIPAHNEEAVIEHTLRRLIPTLGAQDRVLVVADNCTDATADIARRCGADVVQRSDALRRGKVCALEFGLRALAARPPEVVVVLDADCDVEPNTVSTISRRAVATGRPVQALNLSVAEPGDGAVQIVSELGFRFKNLVRPLGLRVLGLPCQLMGTGMALPWSLASAVAWSPDSVVAWSPDHATPATAGLPDFETFGRKPGGVRRPALNKLAGEQLVEDMQLGIDLALAGTPPVFCPDVRVTSRFPQQHSAWLSQRTRWEQGHLRTLFRHVPRLALAGVRRGRLDLLALGLDLLVPPLSLLILTWLGATAVAGAAWLGGASLWPFACLAVGGTATLAAVAAGWFVHCRDRIPPRALRSIPGYVLRKVPIYASFFLRRGERRWVRTERGVGRISNPWRWKVADGDD